MLGSSFPRACVRNSPPVGQTPPPLLHSSGFGFFPAPSRWQPVDAAAADRSAALSTAESWLFCWRTSSTRSLRTRPWTPSCSWRPSLTCLPFSVSTDPLKSAASASRRRLWRVFWWQDAKRDAPAQSGWNQTLTCALSSSSESAEQLCLPVNSVLLELLVRPWCAPGTVPFAPFTTHSCALLPPEAQCSAQMSSTFRLSGIERVRAHQVGH